MVTKEIEQNAGQQIHPWRRYFARMLDYALLNAFLSFLIIVVLRIRPLPGDFLAAVIGVASAAAFVPIEALMLCKWGTTPGKYVCGIRLETLQGGKLRFSQALERAAAVYVKGQFLTVPYLQQYAMLRRYCELTGRSFTRFARYDEIDPPRAMSWDYETGISYSRWERKRGVVLGTLLAVIIALSLTVGIDSIRPRHRGNELTIAQYAENYNNCLELVHDEVQIYDRLQPDGTKYPIPNYQAVIDPSTVGAYVPLEYEYTEENGFVKSVMIQRQWHDVIFVTPLNLAIEPILPILLAQNGVDLRDLQTFSDDFEACLEQPEGECVFNGTIKLQWQIRSENCRTQNGTYYGSDEENPSFVDFTCTITILN